MNKNYLNKYQELQTRRNKARKETMPLDPFGRVAHQYIQESNAFINIAVGSIRSGKTIATIVRFLRYIKQSKYTDFAMAGKTLRALKKNVVRPMLRIMNYYHIPYEYKKQENEIHLTSWGKIIVLYGIEKKGSDEPIKGSTYAGAFLDEVTVMDVEGVRMMISRNSLGNPACIFMTCNPGNPNNFISTDYVHNTEQQESGRCKVFKFLLEDNPSLSAEYVETIKALYPRDSVFYKRNILGEWVSGQGAIYDGFTDENILDPNTINIEDYQWIHFGSDYGVSTTTGYTVIGKTRDGEYHQIDELVFDAKKRGYTQTDSQRADDIITLQDKYNLTSSSTFYVSHDATSLYAELETRKHNGELRVSLDKFKPDTLECISIINSLFHLNKFKICSTCKVTIKQVQGYEWDSRAAENGEDEPVKKDDHMPDAFRAPIVTDIKGHHLLGGVVEW